MLVEEKRLDRWDDFRREVDVLLAARKFDSSSGTYHSDVLFRGQEDASWSLLTTLERWSPHELRLWKYHQHLIAIQKEVESNLDRTWRLPTFGSIVHALSNNSSYAQIINTEELYEFMVYVRHHGFPSPLLDWSRSPYVAAYFGFAGATDETEVAIFAYQEYAGRGKGGWGARPRIVGLGPNVRTHPRHFLQQAEYTVAIDGEEKDVRYCAHESAFDESGQQTQDLLWKYILPGTERISALKYLQAHNITAHSLFRSDDTLMESLAIRQFVIERYD